MSTSNWEAGKARSNYHFDWQRHELAGHDYKWLGRFYGDWQSELDIIKEKAEQKTWRTRGKIYHKDHPDLIAEENDLINAGMPTTTPTLRKWKEFDGIFEKMIDSFGLETRKQAFHIQYPGELLSLHVDKQYEVADDYTKVARFFIFLEDWKPGQFLQMGTSFVQWRKGDILNFDWVNIPHASANAGWDPRCLIQVTGTITRRTEEIIMGNHKEIQL